MKKNKKKDYRSTFYRKRWLLVFHIYFVQSYRWNILFDQLSYTIPIKMEHVNKISHGFTWYLTLNPLQPWNVEPGNEDRINVSIVENFSLANHHSENIGNGIPPTGNQSYQNINWWKIPGKRIVNFFDNLVSDPKDRLIRGTNPNVH